MKTKLTLRLEGDVIERAKAYASQRGTSVSALVEGYFRLLTPPGPAGTSAGGDGASEEAGGGRDGWRARLSPRVRALLGSARGPAPADAAPEDAQEAYRAYLTEKYR